METFKIGDLVWAKMKGFPPWPGRVLNQVQDNSSKKLQGKNTELNGKCVSKPKSEMKKPSSYKTAMHCVFFFGSNNYAWVKENDLKSYFEYKEQFMKRNKSVAIKKAVEATEVYIKYLERNYNIVYRSNDKNKQIGINTQNKQGVNKENVMCQIIEEKLDNNIGDTYKEEKDPFGDVNNETDINVKVENGLTHKKEDSLLEEFKQEFGYLNNKHECKEIKTEDPLCDSEIKNHDMECKSNDMNGQFMSASVARIEPSCSNNSERTENSLSNMDTILQLPQNIQENQYGTASLNRITKEPTYYMCTYCHKKFNEEKELEFHINIIHKGLKFECYDCHKTFPLKCYLKRHINGIHGRINVCTYCKKTFSTIASVNTHINNVHKGIKNSECDICHRKFFAVADLARHIQSVHNKVREHECKECHKMFFDAKSLGRHVNTVHKQIKKYSCDKCYKMFSALSSLKRHIFSYHDVKLKNYKYRCDTCNTQFYDISMRNQHINKVHKKSKLHKCSECNLMCSTMSQLKAHINYVHRKISRYICDICNKRYPHYSGVKVHIDAVHNKINKFKCNTCKKRFSSFSVLYSHIKGVHMKVS